MLPRRALSKAPHLKRLLLRAVSAGCEDGALLCSGEAGRRFSCYSIARAPRTSPPFIHLGFSSTAAQSLQQPPPEQQRNPPSPSDEDEDEHQAGWTTKELLSWPNTISMSRLVLGPVLAWTIVKGYPGIAFCGMLVGGASDWLDGYVARKMGIKSVLGSYLDPLADKVLVASVALSMTYAGLLHPGLVGLMVARDVFLVGGSFIYRARSLGWKWTGWGEFFKISDGGAAKVQPIFISKVNTVFQLALISGALLEPCLPGSNLDTVVWYLSWSAGATTMGSWMAYAFLFYQKGAASVLVQQQQQRQQD